MIKHYNKTNTCDRCGIEKLIPGTAHREYNEKGDWTGNWMCKKCYYRCNYSHITNRRSGNINPISEQTKGDNFEELTYKWRSTISTIPIENMNKKLDSYRSPIDHSRDSELGIIQTKGRLYNRYGWWQFTGCNNEHNKEFDYLICYCASEDGKNIERLYIFPKKEIEKRTAVKITKNPTKRRYVEQWYEKYRINDEYILKRVNEIWKNIMDKD